MAQCSIAPDGAIHTEIFTAPSSKLVFDKMDARKEELEAAGHTGFNRRAIGRNSLCPCGSRLKYKKCCIGRTR